MNLSSYGKSASVDSFDPSLKQPALNFIKSQLVPPSYSLSDEMEIVSSIIRLINNCTRENVDSTVKGLSEKLTYENDFNLFIQLYETIVNIRHSKLDINANLLEELYNHFAPKILPCLSNLKNGLILRYLYDKSILDIEKIRSIIDSTSDVSYFFIDILGFPTNEKSNQRFDKYLEELDIQNGNNMELYKELLQYGYIKDSIEYSIINDSVEDLQYITESMRFDYNSDVNVSPYLFAETNHYSILSFAALFGSKKCYRYLLSKGSKVTEDVTLNIIKSGNIDFIEEFIESNSKIPKACHFAIKHYLPDIYDWLKFNVESTDVSLSTFSKFYDFEHLVEALNQGADINSLNKRGETFLFAACRNDCMSLVSFYISNKGKVNVTNKFGETPLSVSIKQHARTSIISTLIQNGSEINPRNVKETPLITAVLYNVGLIAYLISNGANPNLKNVDGIIPLFVAIKEGKETAAEYLIPKTDIIESTDSITGNTCLLEAANKGLDNIIQLLLEKGAILTAKNNNGESALHLAVKNNFPKTCKILINSGIEINSVDSESNTPKDLALKSGNNEIISLFQ